ncbi:hypothetical protein HOM50_00425 [bacterium]|jgi:hypothetical protein|nr:hypothetical protein [bacterium]MBT5014857.1 hypothetical protein [bacterium]
MDALLQDLDLSIQTLSFVPWWSQWWFMAGITMACMLVVGIGLWLFRSKKKVVELTPQEQVQNSLVLLQKTTATAQVITPAICIQCTDLIKQYLSMVYGFSLIGLSDAQVSDWLKAAQRNDASMVSKDLSTVLIPIFEELYVSKYAGSSIGVASFRKHVSSIAVLTAEYERMLPRENNPIFITFLKTPKSLQQKR